MLRPNFPLINSMFDLNFSAIASGISNKAFPFRKFFPILAISMTLMMFPFFNVSRTGITSPVVVLLYKVPPK